jgi:hypothetical protein
METEGVQKAEVWKFGHSTVPYKVAGSMPDEVNKFFLINLILPAALGPGAFSASERNECHNHNNIGSEE